MPPRRAAGLRDSPAANGESLPAEAFASAVRDALAKLAEPSQLQRHPLTRLLSSEQGPGVKPAQAGQALAHSLSEAIERQRPSPGTVERSRAWRRYHILRLRYLEGHDSVEVQRQLALGKSQYYLDRNHAVQAVIASLAEQWHVAVDPPPPTLPENDAKTEAPPGYLPAPVTSFVGREREVTALRRLLTAGAQPAGTGAFHPRLVTVTGPAGTGKTRLVIEVAAALGGAFADGVHLAPLALIGDPGLVLPAIGRAFGIPEAGARPMAERLAQAVRHRQALLVLDNFEQVL
ncbi:MAG TPA: AAA family ATPase, partial [Chloroflexota bacterium]